MITNFKSAAFAFVLAIATSTALAAPPNQTPVQPGQAVGPGIVISIPGGPAIGGGGLPMQMYYTHVGTLYDGDYRLALEGYRADLDLGRKTSNSRWIDSICYYTMIGESYYHAGKYADALENYNAALQLQLAFPNWMTQVHFPPSMQANLGNVVTPWGRSNRTAKIWNPANQYMQVEQGQLFLNLQPNSSQIVAPPQLLNVGVARDHPLHGAGDEAAAGNHGTDLPARYFHRRLVRRVQPQAGPAKSLVGKLGRCGVGDGLSGQRAGGPSRSVFEASRDAQR